MSIFLERLMNAPRRHWSEELHDVSCVYILPTDNMHDSGYNCMMLVAEVKDNKRGLVMCGGGCDDIALKGDHFRIDCIYPEKILRVWNRAGFTVTHDLSSIDFVENNLTGGK